MLRRILLLLLLSCSAQAQWAFEIDPLAYFSKGYSGHLIYQTSNGFSFDLGAYGMEFPDFAEPYEGFKTRFTGYGVKIIYHGRSKDGAFWGIGAGTNDFEVEETAPLTTQTGTFNSAGIQTGYRWGKQGFYVTPWIGIDYILNPPKLQFSSRTYDFPRVNIFPTVHIGYQF